MTLTMAQQVLARALDDLQQMEGQSGAPVEKVAVVLASVGGQVRWVTSPQASTEVAELLLNAAVGIEAEQEVA